MANNSKYSCENKLKEKLFLSRTEGSWGGGPVETRKIPPLLAARVPYCTCARCREVCHYRDEKWNVPPFVGL